MACILTVFYLSTEMAMSASGSRFCCLRRDIKSRLSSFPPGGGDRPSLWESGLSGRSRCLRRDVKSPVHDTGGAKQGFGFTERPPGDVRHLHRDVKSRQLPNIVPRFFYEAVENKGLFAPVLRAAMLRLLWAIPWAVEPAFIAGQKNVKCRPPRLSPGLPPGLFNMKISQGMHERDQ